MAFPSSFLKLRGDDQPTRAQDNINASLEPIAKALNATPIMGAPPPSWIRPSVLTGGFSNFGGGFAVVAFHKDALGYVHVKGFTTSVAGSAAFSVIFTLPQGYRPSEVRRFPAEANGAYQGVQVYFNGDVSNVIIVAAGGFISTEFSFLAEQ